MSPLDWAFLPLQRYFTFYGRSPRAEYWYFWLLQLVVTIMTGMLDLVLGLGTPEAPLSSSLIVGLALFIPALAVTVRRLHDINRSGWTVLVYSLLAIPVAIGGAVVGGLLGFDLWLMVLGMVALTVNFMILMATDGNAGDNHFGPNPYGRAYGC